jgi:hypothetical protein
MGANGKMGNRKSTCLYLDKEIVETARRIGLNVSRVSENARALIVLMLNKYTKSFIKHGVLKYIVNLNIEYEWGIACDHLKSWSAFGKKWKKWLKRRVK